MKRIVILFFISAMFFSSCRVVRFSDEVKATFKINDFSREDAIPASGTISDKMVKLDDFLKIDASIKAELTYCQLADSAAAQIVAPDNMLDDIICEVEDSCLSIRIADNKKYKNEKVKLFVCSSSLNDVNVKGAVDFDIPGVLSTSGLDIGVQGAGNIEIDRIDCTGNLSVTIDGVGNVEIDNITGMNAKAVINGAGNVEMSGTVENASLVVNGAGNIDVKDLCVKGDLSTKINGAGHIDKPDK